MSNSIGRREILGGLASAGAAGVLEPYRLAAAQPGPPAHDPIISASATELAAAIRAKQMTSQEIVEAYLARIAVVNPKLNAIVQLTANDARKGAADADA